MISQVTSRPAAAQHLRDLARLRRVRDRIDREYAQPLDVEALARGAHMPAGHLSREFRLAYGESPYGYLRTRRIVAGHLQQSLHRPGRCAAQRLSAPGGARDGGDAVVRGETGDQTDQESRSAGHGAAAGLTAMDITIHASFLPHNDPDASLAFYRDTLGFEVRNDVGYGGMRWITVGPADQPGTSIVLHPPAADPGITDDERRTIVEMMAKGSYAVILLATADLDGVFERVRPATPRSSRSRPSRITGFATAPFAIPWET